MVLFRYFVCFLMVLARICEYHILLISTCLDKRFIVVNKTLVYKSLLSPLQFRCHYVSSHEN
jgi:hypothetical protein